ncbi:MAG: hypothetical protein AB8V43_03585 [Coxiella endosymbiont of Dermacentor nuttalli]
MCKYKRSSHQKTAGNQSARVYEIFYNQKPDYLSHKMAISQCEFFLATTPLS